MNPYNPLAEKISGLCEGKPKGGEQYQNLLKTADSKGVLDIFIPWAAPPSGRKLNKEDLRTIAYTFGDEGLVNSLSSAVRTRTIVMPADSYAQRNGFDMDKANQYWSDVRETIGQTSVRELIWLPSSVIEQWPSYTKYRATEAYALEKLDPKTREKIVDAASKYNADSPDSYESAAEYAMGRAAEGRVVRDMGALWVSLNWPERDAMCGDTPRIYTPIEVRTPWLKE